MADTDHIAEIMARAAKAQRLLGDELLMEVLDGEGHKAFRLFQHLPHGATLEQYQEVKAIDVVVQNIKDTLKGYVQQGEQEELKMERDRGLSGGGE